VAIQLHGPSLEAPSVDILPKTAVAFDDAYSRRHAMIV